MKRDDLQAQLDVLRSAAQRISTNLVELEIDPGRQLLDVARLDGSSAQRWAQADVILTELWRRQNLLESLLQRADGTRGFGRVEELRRLLEEDSIELAGGAVPLAERQLLGTARATRRCSPKQLLTWMATSFEEVKVTIGELTGAWEQLTPRLERAQRLLEEARALVEPLGQGAGVDLEPAAQELARLRQQLACDPLSVGPDQIDDLEHDLREQRTRLEETAGLRQGFEARITEARVRLDRLRSVTAAAQAVQRELMLKVSVPSAAPAPEFDRRLEVDLESIHELGADERWEEARCALKDWTARIDAAFAQARERLEANRAPIQARNQFRALLDAYKVKAQRLGVLEDPELQRIFAQAQEVLYNAPSDLGQAAQLVRSYQLVLNGAGSTPEATA